METIPYYIYGISWAASLLIGWMLDALLGDPEGWPHPVVWFGRLISAGEHRWNRGGHRRMKGGLLAVGCVAVVYVATLAVLTLPWLLTLFPWGFWPTLVLQTCLSSILIFFCLAGRTLRREVRLTFEAVDRSVAEGRKQVARIVGRDTGGLDAQEIRTAALETLAENLSDGVVAPLFWLLLLGVPGMMAYKMVNTLDSMIGYRTERFRDFGCFAARMDDVANFVPARLTALLMMVVGRVGYGRKGLWRFVSFFGPRHVSPNSGWPEAALAGILGCRFGGSHTYFGECFDKPFIGSNPRLLTSADVHLSLRIAQWVEVMAVTVTAFLLLGRAWAQ